MSNTQYKPSIHPSIHPSKKHLGAQHTKTRAIVKQLAFIRHYTIPNDLDLDLYFPLLSLTKTFFFGGVRLTVPLSFTTTNREQILKNLYIVKNFDLQSWKFTCIWASFFNFFVNPNNPSSRNEAKLIDFIFFGLLVMLSSCLSFITWWKCWSVELREIVYKVVNVCQQDTLWLHGVIMCWVTWGLLIGFNPRCFEFLPLWGDPIREGSLD
jgi:hypothetical protein